MPVAVGALALALFAFVWHDIARRLLDYKRAAIKKPD